MEKIFFVVNWMDLSSNDLDSTDFNDLDYRPVSFFEQMHAVPEEVREENVKHARKSLEELYKAQKKSAEIYAKRVKETWEEVNEALAKGGKVKMISAVPQSSNSIFVGCAYIVVEMP